MTTSATAMTQVEDGWERHLYKHAHDWQLQDLPPEVKARLVDCSEMDGKVDENNLVQLKADWLM